VEPGGSERLVGVLRELPGLVDRGGMRGHLVLADATDRLAEESMLLRQLIDVEVGHCRLPQGSGPLVTDESPRAYDYASGAAVGWIA
jgi:hypothetical protein